MSEESDRMIGIFTIGYLVKKFGSKLIGAHVNFLITPSNDWKDAEILEIMCDRYGVRVRGSRATSTAGYNLRVIVLSGISVDTIIGGDYIKRQFKNRIKNIMGYEVISG